MHATTFIVAYSFGIGLLDFGSYILICIPWHINLHIYLELVSLNLRVKVTFGLGLWALDDSMFASWALP